jgi:hypothetical protein
MKNLKMAAIAAIAALSIGATANAQTSTTKKGGNQTEVSTQTKTEVNRKDQYSEGMASVKAEVKVIRDNYEAGRITKDQAKEQLKAIHERLKAERKARVAEIKAQLEAGKITKEQAKAELKAEKRKLKAIKHGLKVKNETRLELRKEKKGK